MTLRFWWYEQMEWKCFSSLLSNYKTTAQIIMVWFLCGCLLQLRNQRSLAIVTNVLRKARMYFAFRIPLRLAHSWASERAFQSIPLWLWARKDAKVLWTAVFMCSSHPDMCCCMRTVHAVSKTCADIREPSSWWKLHHVNSAQTWTAEV